MAGGIAAWRGRRWVGRLVADMVRSFGKPQDTVNNSVVGGLITGKASTLPVLCFSCVGELPGSVELVHETSATQPVDGVWGGVGAAWLGLASWRFFGWVCWGKSELLVGDKLGNDNPFPLSMVALW
uniref:Uncharacterized protein n=1 Tax=Oryza meridionalis TaxID=40149 RepID=A0A0E0D5W5_9ORYZ